MNQPSPPSPTNGASMQIVEDRTAAQIISIMTTEQTALQGVRSNATADASSRASLFIGTVSSTLVALAFVAQLAHLGAAFYAFSLVLFPTLFCVGLFTFQRVLQSDIADHVAARGINRIRHFYTEVAPHLAPYFVHATNDDAAGVGHNVGMRSLWWQGFLNTAGMIAFLNSVILSVPLGLAAYLVLSALLGAIIVGALTFVVTLFAQQNYQYRQWDLMDRQVAALFPTDLAQ